MLRCNLPDEITLPNGAVLKPVIGGCIKRRDGQHITLARGAGTNGIIAAAKEMGLRYRVVKVLHRNLRGKFDLHGRPYAPNTWVLVEEK